MSFRPVFRHSTKRIIVRFIFIACAAAFVRPLLVHADPAELHPRIRYSADEKQDLARDRDSLQKSENVVRALSAGSKDLLPLVPYTASERDQGYCGNCWVWAGTGVVEVALRNHFGSGERLSVQYLNSNFNQGGTISSQYGGSSSFACNGGTESKFASFYNGPEGGLSLIPWSNTNASFADYNGGQSGGYNGGKKTNMLASNITTSPSYSISDMDVQVISTYGVGATQAISNIKAMLDQNIALQFDFYLPDDSSWDAFGNFWNNSSEDTLFDFDPYDQVAWNDSQGGGHAVLLVGYDDTDSDSSKHYWKMLNSWGTTAQRPNGAFKVKMNMNYDNVDGTYSEQNLYFVALLPTFSSDAPVQTPTAAPTATSTPIETPIPVPSETPAVEPTPTPGLTHDPSEVTQLTLAANALKNKAKSVVGYKLKGIASTVDEDPVPGVKVSVVCRMLSGSRSKTTKTAYTGTSGNYAVSYTPSSKKTRRCSASATGASGKVKSKSVKLKF